MIWRLLATALLSAALSSGCCTEDMQKIQEENRAMRAQATASNAKARALALKVAKADAEIEALEKELAIIGELFDRIEQERER